MDAKGYESSFAVSNYSEDVDALLNVGSGSGGASRPGLSKLKVEVNVGNARAQLLNETTNASFDEVRLIGVDASRGYALGPFHRWR